MGSFTICYTPHDGLRRNGWVVLMWTPDDDHDPTVHVHSSSPNTHKPTLNATAVTPTVSSPWPVRVTTLSTLCTVIFGGSNIQCTAISQFKITPHVFAFSWPAPSISLTSRTSTSAHSGSAASSRGHASPVDTPHPSSHSFVGCHRGWVSSDVSLLSVHRLGKEENMSDMSGGDGGSSGGDLRSWRSEEGLEDEAQWQAFASLFASLSLGKSVCTSPLFSSSPEAMEKNLTKLGIADKYSFERPGRAPGPHIVESYAAVNSIVRDRATFHTSYVPRVQHIFENRASGYLASLNDPVQYKAYSELLINSLANDASALEKAEQFYFDTTQALIKQKSFTLSGSAGYGVDLVGEVLNLILVHFAATAIHELQQMLRDVFSYVFFEVEAAKKMHVEHFAGLHTQELLGHIKTNVKNIGQTASLELTPRLNTNGPLFPFMHNCIHFIFMPGEKSRLFWNLLPASTLVGLSSPSCMTPSISFSPLVHNYVTPRLNTSWPVFPFMYDCITGVN
ncbi:hypothetical protein BU17DRAFT_72152 [Hysterangium stoloniferum]|nr:hypothetical protein BU17DRAFT_72152 [Hysterangium stoloniferum]